jgi:hypothetical protein
MPDPPGLSLRRTTMTLAVTAKQEIPPPRLFQSGAGGIQAIPWNLDCAVIHWHLGTVQE